MTAPLSRRWSVAAFVLALAAILASLLHALANPAFSVTDEPWVLFNLDKALDGHGLPICLGRGNLTLLAQLGISALFEPSLSALRLGNAAMLAAEALLAYRLARLSAGRAAALGALLVCVVAATTPLRARALSSFAWLPFWSLLVANLYHGGKAWMPSVSGLLAGLLLLDYEGWMLALPGLACFLLISKGPDPKRKPFFWGLSLGVLAVALLSLPFPESWWAQRSKTLLGAASDPLASALKGFNALFRGGANEIPHLALRQHPFLPPWSWPWLALGLWVSLRQRPGLLLWAAFPLSAVFLHSAEVESNRMIGAWPAFALMAGMGVQWLAERIGGPKACLLLLLTCLLGAPFEARAWLAHWKSSAWSYDAAHAALEAQKMLGEEQGRVLLTRAHGAYGVGGGLRYAARSRPAAAAASGLAVLLPRDLLSALGPHAPGQLLTSAHGTLFTPALYLPSAAEEARFLGLEKALEEMERGILVSTSSEEARLRRLLLQTQGKDPLYRALLWERWIETGRHLGVVNAEMGRRLLQEPGRPGLPLRMAALALAQSEPALARALLAEYERREPGTLTPTEQNWLKAGPQGP